ncbi:MAG: efflux RND transporter periplasmic adaptor subunit [Fibrobacterales bacterium]
MKQSEQGSIIKIILPIILVAAAFGIAVVMVKKGQTQAETNIETKYPLVTSKVLKPVTTDARFEATGTVKAGQQVTILPEVNGTVSWISQKLTPGGIVSKGQLLVRIDDREYKLQVNALKAQVKAAEIELTREEARGKLARNEWKISGEKGKASPLVTRELQLESAKLNLSSAKSSLEQAELRLSKAEIRAPFNASVASENVDIGQVVGPQSQIVRLVGTGDLRLEINVPIEALAKISLGSGRVKGSEVTVCQKLSNDRCVEAKGYVVHVVGELDAQTRQAKLNITIPEKETRKGEIPLLPGAFVTTSISGTEEEVIYTIPRKNVHNKNRIWTLLSDSTIQEVEMEIRWTDKEFVYGLIDKPEVSLVTTKLAAPVNGLRVDPVQ